MQYSGRLKPVIGNQVFLLAYQFLQLVFCYYLFSDLSNELESLIVIHGYKNPQTINIKLSVKNYRTTDRPALLTPEPTEAKVTLSPGPINPRSRASEKQTPFVAEDMFPRNLTFLKMFCLGVGAIPSIYLRTIL